MKHILENIISTIEIVQIEDIFSFFEKSGDIFIVKYDGIRLEKKYTIMIMSKNNTFEMIRCDESNLRKGLLFALSEYLKLELFSC